MRKAFVSTLISIAEKNSKVVLLTGDLGYMVLEPFAERFKNRFFNVGVAEQNMIGVATGLAESGYIPFVYSIATFATLRGYEFIRNGPILHKLPVRIIGVGGGFEYGHNGITHYGLEDLAVMRTQPGISIFAPADHLQTKTILESTWQLPGPIYYRLGKDEQEVPNLDGKFSFDNAELIQKGNEIAIFAIGNIALEVSKAVSKLKEKGIDVSFYVLSSLSSNAMQNLCSVLSKYKNVISVEAHYINGGLGSLLSEVIAENKLNCGLTRKGVASVHDGLTGSKEYMYSKHGIDSESICEAVNKLLQ